MLKHIDLAVLALALPVFLVAGFPLAGYLTGAVVYVVQKLVKMVAEGRAQAIARQAKGERRDDPKVAAEDMRRVVGLTAGSTIARGWFCGLGIFAGWFIAGREDPVGLSAALLILVCLTSYFASVMAVRPVAITPNEMPS